MNCSLKGFGGGKVVINGEDVKLKFFLIREKCKLKDITSIRFQPASAIRLGCVEIFSRNQPASSYVIFFWSEKKELRLGQFFQELLNELRRSHQSQGTFHHGQWTWH